ncbi:trypco2 family protein [Streptomyces coeruleorubidus]|uniref:trypco2 family protein n=1 Tax=Streptomyces coeruleorubidus TaxID=116188 RepID=UPI0033BBD51D
MIELSEMIRQLRWELNAAMADGAGERVRFELGTVEIETTVAVDREAEANGKVRFWVVEAGGSGRDTRSRTQRITLTLQPKAVAPDGTSRNALISGGEVDGER